MGIMNGVGRESAVINILLGHGRKYNSNLPSCVWCCVYQSVCKLRVSCVQSGKKKKKKKEIDENFHWLRCQNGTS